MRSVRYRKGSDNAVLRSVLHDLWGSKCYWCTRPKDFNDIEIDHILPRTAKGARLQELVERFGLATDFDVDDPRNLAPICKTCNGTLRKSDAELLGAPVVLTTLNRAESLRSEVVRRVMTFNTPGRLAKALILAKDARLDDAVTRDIFEEHAPAVVQKLALLGDDKVEFVLFRTAEVDVGGTFHDVGISLDRAAQRATAVLEDVCGLTLEELLDEAIADVSWHVHGDVHDSFEGLEDSAGPVNAGDPEATFLRIDVDAVALQRTGTLFEFTVGGDFEGLLSASLVQQNSDGDGLAELQADAHVTGRYSFVVTWDATDPQAVDVGESSFEEWDADVWKSP